MANKKRHGTILFFIFFLLQLQLEHANFMLGITHLQSTGVVNFYQQLFIRILFSTN